MQTHISPSTTVGTWLLQETLALLAYTKTDETFAESLAAVIHDQAWHDELTLTDKTVSPFIVPHTQRDATTIAHWLIRTMHDQPQAAAARGTLRTFAHNYVDPKNLILGIVGVAIIGPTLGLIQTKKKKKPKAQLVYDATWYSALPIRERAAHAIELTQAIVAKELRLAGGTITRLHPDTATWVMSEPITRIATTSNTELTALIQAADSERLRPVVRATEHGPVAIALSPRINDEFVGGFSVTTV